MEVNTSELLEKYNSLKNDYKLLEENQMNLFAQLSTICNVDWQDGNSLVFSGEVEEERLETDNFQIYTMEKLEIFNYIYNKYVVLGKKVMCNLNRKSEITTAINNCVIQIDSIINEFHKTDLNFPYHEFHILRRKYQKFVNLKNRLNNINDYFDSLFTKIENIESEIATKIRELGDFKTREFNFSPVGNSEATRFANLEEDTFITDYEKVELYKNEEKKLNAELYKGMRDINSSYKSENNTLYIANLNNYNYTADTLYEKRNAYLQGLDLIPPIYGITTKKSIDRFEEEDNE